MVYIGIVVVILIVVIILSAQVGSKTDGFMRGILVKIKSLLIRFNNYMNGLKQFPEFYLIWTMLAICPPFIYRIEKLDSEYDSLKEKIGWIELETRIINAKCDTNIKVKTYSTNLHIELQDSIK